MKKCEFCQKEFKARNRKGRSTKSARFCNSQCYWDSMTILLHCQTCGKKFKRASNGVLKYCSTRCKKNGEWGKLNKIVNLGRKQNEETLEKRLRSMRKRFLSKEPTSIEKKIYDYLLLKNISFEKQKVVGNKFIVDAYIPSLNLVIEADGDYWHSREDNKIKDKKKNEYLKTKGFNLIRLTETEINNGTFIERMVI
jgi:very-short-patch-repair endonuclease